MLKICIGCHGKGGEATHDMLDGAPVFVCDDCQDRAIPCEPLTADDLAAMQDMGSDTSSDSDEGDDNA